jgi:very-short-patch-repair endonuclease
MLRKKTKDYQENLNFGATPEIISKAKELRRKMTGVENILWDRLRNRRLTDFKFRRQHPIWIFIADFYCHEAKLVVELDGDIHKNPEVKERDENRNYEIERFGIKVLRFANEEVENDLEKVLGMIEAECKQRINDI